MEYGHFPIEHSERPWGSFDQFVHNQSCTVKLITVHPHESLSLQYHQHRAEYWVIISGSGVVTIGDERREMKKGDRCEIVVGASHRVEAGEEGVLFLEIAVGDFDEKDIVRLEDKYGRVNI